MRQPLRGGRVAALVTALPLLLATAPAASAHVTEASGPFRVELGWGSEPPLAGQANSVEVGVSDAAGAPIAVPAGALSVEVASLVAP